MQVETKEKEEIKEPRLIIVIGVEDESRQFLLEALCQIISKSGYSVSAEDFGTKQQTDFHIVTGKEFNIEMEAKARLVFGSYRDPIELLKISQEKMMDDFPDEVEYLNYREENRDKMLKTFHELLKWMRSSKLAHVSDYDSPHNAKGLHNYTTLRNLILPMNFAFQAEGMRFDKIKPTDLIESLVPQLKEDSNKASQKFESAKEVKLKEEKYSE